MIDELSYQVFFASHLIGSAILCLKGASKPHMSAPLLAATPLPQ